MDGWKTSFFRGPAYFQALLLMEEILHHLGMVLKPC